MSMQVLPAFDSDLLESLLKTSIISQSVSTIKNVIRVKNTDRESCSY